MIKKDVARRELQERWSAIEQEDGDDDGGLSSLHPIKRRRLRQLKEQWFSDVFSYLINLPKGTHVWCGNWDLMGPLLETFYNYVKEEANDSPLKILWKRISGEMRHCTLCIHQHHQAQEMYSTEYEQSCISPLLDVLQTLDEERVTLHLKDLNSRLLSGEYDQTNDYGEVVSVLFEVLMFPILFADLSLATEFQFFIEAIDNTHELTLGGHQQFPGVYALFFSQSRRVRSIGLRLAGHMGKLRMPKDLDPLQNVLMNFILILEVEGVKAASERSRPRVDIDRVTVWMGMKALIGFLEPHAFEEGILDRYPVFLSIVLNHISDDSSEFSHAVNCLKLLLEKLGYKLWWRATLSPAVMKNTLFGQCFHARNEKTHKEIFDLFQPFLQSLEALQDGEHEKQRRHFLYFLLHQVPVSSNFSTLMRKKACQIALLIVLRGYRMDPPCPPSECAHMWGPSLLSSLKDASLHSSLRQPAFDLIQTIIISDASALISVILSSQLHPSDKPIMPTNCVDVEDEYEIHSGLGVNETDDSCWIDFSRQYKIISQVEGSWMCAPMLWFDVLIETDPMVLPHTFSKAVFWALSRFSLIEPDNGTEMALCVRDWLSCRAPEISYLFGWKLPSSSDDGGDATESRNSIRTSTMCLPLVRTFKRFTAHYIVKMEQVELRKHWTWDPMMSNSLILFLVDPNDSTRQVGRLILEKVSNVSDLTGGLQFLCSTPSSLSSLLSGLKHALELVYLDSVSLSFRTLHHLFFVMSKFLKEGNTSAPSVLLNKSAVSGSSKFSSQGGFLKQPVCNSSPSDCDGHSLDVASEFQNKFCCLLSQVAWRSILKCLEGGKPFINFTVSQMTCIRLLEIMPFVFEWLSRNSGLDLESPDGLKWLHDLADWGKSSLPVVVRYWKQTFAALLNAMKEFCNTKAASAIRDIEKLILCEEVLMGEVSNQVARLSVSLMDERSALGYQPKHSPFDESLKSVSCLTEETEILQCDKPKVSRLEFDHVIDKDAGVIVLSDDDDPVVSSHTGFGQSRSNLTSHFDKKNTGKGYNAGLRLKQFTTHEELMVSPKVHDRLSSSHSTNFLKAHPGISKQREGKQIEGGVSTMDNIMSVNLKDTPNETVIAKQLDSCGSQSYPSPKIISDPTSTREVHLTPNEAVIAKQLDSCGSLSYPSPKVISDPTLTREVHLTITKPLKSPDQVKGVENNCDDDDDSWQFSFFKPQRQQQGLVTKPIISVPKRQVIQLNVPVEKRFWSMRRDHSVKRFKPLQLDEWYRPILELDFFAAVGSTSPSDKESQHVTKLKEIPICFRSPDEYVDIFRPLVLEEFKAQLQSSYQECPSAEEMYYGRIAVLSVERNDDFHVVRFVHDENGSKNLFENDLILITRKPLQTSSCDIHAVGKVERREKDSKRKLNISAIRLYLQGCSRLNRVRKLLTDRSKWHVSRVMSITPQLREFQALSSIREIPLLPLILNPVNHSNVDHGLRNTNLSKLSKPLQQIMQSSYNTSQLQAINLAIGLSGLNKDLDLTLIQGPPGTGKTRTIVAIVSCLLASSQVKDSTSTRNDNSVYSNIPGTKEKISQSTAIARAWQDASLARQLNQNAEKNISSRSCSRGRILICAQSNAAVDELIARISSEGLYGCDGRSYKPYLVRIGNAKTVHSNSLPFFIDTLVESRLVEENKNSCDEKYSGTSADDSTMIRDKLEKLLDQIRYYEAKRANLQEGNSDTKNLVEGESEDFKVLSDTELKIKLRQLYEKKKATHVDLVNAQAREKKVSEEIRSLKLKCRSAILREAEIVVTTLSGCGGDLFKVCAESTSVHKFIHSSESCLFDAIVIDEAAQALEPATLIPLQLLKSRGTKCIMVGDPKQLPATVLSNIATKYSFQCSMFERLQRAGHPVILLTQQYRMHPEICCFPSSHFYDGKLLNGEDMVSKATPFHETQFLGPYVFFDIVDGKELRGKNTDALSVYNECEADAAVEVLKFLKKKYPSEFYGGRIGIITPYKSQLSLLRSQFSNAFGSSATSEMEFNTVDGFQGREVDILLLSTVRASGSWSEKGNNIGFVADVRRMNVALTRARHSLWVFGNAKTLQTNKSWSALVEDAKHRKLIISGQKPYTNFMLTSGLDNNNNRSSSSGNPPCMAKGTKKRKYSNSNEDIRYTAKEKPKGAECNSSLMDDDRDKRACRESGEKMNVGKAKCMKIPDGERSTAITTKTVEMVGGSSCDRSFKEDTIRKRKEQREAVEALLSSSLLSSKTSKPTTFNKKTVPMKNTKVNHMRPPKPKPRNQS